MKFLELPQDIHIAICQRVTVQDLFTLRCANKYIRTLTYLLVVLREIHRDSTFPLPALHSSKTAKELDKELQFAYGLHMRLAARSPISQSHFSVLIGTARLWVETINIIPGGLYVLTGGRIGFELIHIESRRTWMMFTQNHPHSQNLLNAFCMDNAEGIVPTLYVAYRTKISSGLANCHVKCQPLSDTSAAPTDFMDIPVSSEISAMHANGRFLALGCDTGEVYLVNLRTKDIRMVHPASGAPIIDLCIRLPYILSLHPPDLTLSMHVLPLPHFGDGTTDFTTIPLKLTDNIGPTFFSVPATDGHASGDLIHIIADHPARNGLTTCTIRYLPSTSFPAFTFKQTAWASSRFGPEFFQDPANPPSLPERPFSPAILSLGRGISPRMVSLLGATNDPQTPLVLSEVIVEDLGEKDGKVAKLVHKKLQIHDEELAKDLERQISLAAFDEISGRVFLTDWTAEHRLLVLQF